MSAITLIDDLADRQPMAGTEMLGYGVNPFGDLRTVRRMVCDTRGTEEEWEFDNKTYYHAKSIQPSKATSGDNWSEGFLEREDYQSSVSANVGITAKYGAFTGRFSATFSSDYEAFIENAAAMKFYAETLWKLHLRDKTVDTAFANAVTGLPAKYEGHEAEFYQFFHDWGAYVVTDVIVGGSMEYGMLVRRAHVKSSQDLAAQASAEFGTCFEGTGGAKEREEIKRSSEYITRKLTTKGGTSASFDLDNPQDWSQQFNTWKKSISGFPVVVSLTLTEITDSEFIKDSGKQQVLTQALERYMRTYATIESKWSESTISVGGAKGRRKAASGPSLRVVFVDRASLKREETAFPAPDPGSSADAFDRYWSGVHELLVKNDPQYKMLLLATERWPRDPRYFPSRAVRERLKDHGASMAQLNRWDLLTKNALPCPVAGVTYVLAGGYGEAEPGKERDAVAVGFGAGNDLQPTATVKVLLPHLETDGRIQVIRDNKPSTETHTTYYVVQNWASYPGPVLAAETTGSSLLLQGEDPKKLEQYWYKLAEDEKYGMKPFVWINYLTCGVIEGKPGAARSAVTSFPSPMQDDWMWDIRGGEGQCNFVLLYFRDANWNLATAEGTRVQVRTWDADDHAMLWRLIERKPA